jgi:hypothetical protein
VKKLSNLLDYFHRRNPILNILLFVLSIMRYFTDVTLAFLAVFLCTTAVAAEADVEPGCIVPLVIFNSLPKPFELSALIPGRPVPRPGGFTSQPEIPIRLVSVERLRIPIISNARIAPTQFRLQDQKLLAGDDDARLFPIREIFPYLLTAFAFGDDDSLSELNFTAGYACDTTGNVILQLFVEDGVSQFFFITISLFPQANLFSLL